MSNGIINGIYTLANDVVFDQAVALLNSIEVNQGKETPVCVIAYNQRVERLKEEIAHRPQVTLMDDPALFAPWEDFSRRVWATHPQALQTWREEKGLEDVYRLECNHRYAAFDPQAPFDRFIYLDADTLVLHSLDPVFAALDNHDFVIYDFQHRDPTHIFNVDSPRLQEIFEPSQLQANIFCSGFFASKKGTFPPERRDWLVEQLAAGDAEVLYLAAPNQSVLNYMALRSRLSICNLALELPADQVTGNSVTSSHFEERDQRLYDRGIPVTYLHYIGLSSKLFTKLAAGENIDFPYRDLFLHYRFLHEPEHRPDLTGTPRPYNAPPSLQKRVLRKIGLVR
ncbi:MAG: Npun_R2821/Npun_R2822 family protein [Elainellaceae cyanobacterium]